MTAPLQTRFVIQGGVGGLLDEHGLVHQKRTLFMVCEDVCTHDVAVLGFIHAGHQHRYALGLAGRPKLFGVACGAAMSNRRCKRNDRRAHTLFGGGVEYWNVAAKRSLRPDGVVCHFLSPFAQNAHHDMNIRSLQTNEIMMAISVAPRV